MAYYNLTHTDTTGKEYRNNSKTVKFHNHKYGNYYITVYYRDYVDTGDKLVFRIVLTSYATDVIYIDMDNDKKEYTMEVTGLYSMTTRKHISWFIERMFGHTYKYFKIRYDDIRKNETPWGYPKFILSNDYGLSNYEYVMHLIDPHKW